MRVSLFGILVNLALNYLLVARFGHKGLAITASALLSINALGLMLGLRGELRKLPLSSPLQGLLALTLAAVLALLLQSYCAQTFAFEVLPASWPEKTRVVLPLLGNAMIVGLIFALVGLLRLGKSPRKVLNMAKNLKRKK